MFKLLNVKTTKTTLATSVNSMNALAEDLTNVACSAVVNYYIEKGNPALVGHVFNTCNKASNKVTNAAKSFITQFVGVSLAKDEVTKDVLKDSNGFTIYKKNTSKYDIFITKAVDEGVNIEDKAELTEYVTTLLNDALELKGGTILTVVKPVPKTKAEKLAAARTSFQKSLKSATSKFSTSEIIADLEKAGLMDIIEAHLDFQAEVTS